MIKSMTGYAKAENANGRYVINIEIRSLNSRHLDIFLRIPHRYMALEEKIKRLVTNSLERGRIEISVRIKDESEEAFAFEVNLPKASAYFKAIDQLRTHFKLDSQTTMEHLLALDGILSPAEPAEDFEDLWSVVEAGLRSSLDNLIEMRATEGAHLAQDLLERIALLEEHVGIIEKTSDGLLGHYQARLKDRIDKLTAGLIEIEPFRIAQEAALLADRSDISEEIVRVNSHLKQLNTMMQTDEPVGRKINFIIQELNREFNTIGSKTGSTGVSHKVVELKSELEKMREQVQNIE